MDAVKDLKMKSPWIGVALNPVTNVLMKETPRRDTKRRESHVQKKA